MRDSGVDSVQAAKTSSDTELKVAKKDIKVAPILFAFL